MRLDFSQTNNNNNNNMLFLSTFDVYYYNPFVGGVYLTR